MRIIGNDGKEYKTIKECEAADKALAEQQRKAQEKADALKAQRALRADEIKEAYDELVAANKKYNDLVQKFVKDYGSYHKTIHQGDLFESLFDALWKW